MSTIQEVCMVGWSCSHTVAHTTTLHQVVVAAHCGLRVLGLSLITNRCLAPGDTHTPPTHEEVLAAVEGSQT